MPPATSPRRLMKRYEARAALVMAVVLALLLGSRAYDLRRIAAAPEAAQQRAVEQAYAYVSEAYLALRTELEMRAQALAEHEAVIRALSSEPAPAEVEEALLREVERLPLPPRGAVEVLTRQMKSAAWNGFSMPVGPADRTPTLRYPRTSIVYDGEAREALAVWWPVREGARVLGYVRVLRMIRSRAPLQNEYLRDYSLAAGWSRATGLDIALRTEAAPPSEGPAEEARVLPGVGGEPAASVVIRTPTPEELRRRTAEVYADLLALWATVLAVLVGLRLWTWARAARAVGGAALRFGVWLAAVWALRFGMLTLHVPARWQANKGPLAPLFDPTHLASTIASGLFQSIGDLMLTAGVVLLSAGALLDLVSRCNAALGARTEPPARRGQLLDAAASLGCLLLAVLCLFGLAYTVQHMIFDSTLDYFARSGLLPRSPERLVVFVFGALLLLTLGALLLAVGLLWLAMVLLCRLPLWGRASEAARLAATAGLAAAAVLVFALLGGLAYAPPAAIALFGGIAWGTAFYRYARREGFLPLLTLRGVLLFVFLLSLLLYPIFHQGMATRRQRLMESAIDAFEGGRDPRALFAIGQTLEQMLALPEASAALAQGDPAARPLLDSVATEVVRASLLSTMGPYDVGLTLLDRNGRTAGRYYETDQILGRVALAQEDSLLFETLRYMYLERGAGGPMVEQVTSRTERERFQNVGLAPVVRGGETVGWVMVRAEPQAMLGAAETPYPRVLLPGGFSGSLHSNFSLAEFRDGVLVRSIGQDFGRYRLREAVRDALREQPELWTRDEVEEIEYLAYYRRHVSPSTLPSAVLAPPSERVVAVRTHALSPFDHLYYLLRLTAAGLFIGAPLYLIGLGLRRRAGLLPAPRVYFRDKVLNAFIAVGIFSVGAVGMVGRAFIRQGEEAAVQSWLRQNLERVEEALALQARPNELPYHVMARTPVDSLATRVGLEINLYEQEELVASSRPQLVRDRLIDRRLPLGAYKALFHEGARFVVASAELGSFRYKVGFRALLDEDGRPRYILSVPTLAQQERLQEEQARTIAYLFGALLLLVIVVLATASVLASALARPVGRLRAGLEAVAQGQFEQPIPVESRDEIGELVETFNSMQQQLAESRIILAQQERQLAWREMARQVAHEIKNPLTPMKLSVQHLQRAFYGAAGPALDGRFAGLFTRITGTLIEQIDALARIANEFHSFARMPTRMLERLDLNAVVREAVSLMQEEQMVAVALSLHPEALWVEADREELRRIFINLIKNGVEAIPDGREGAIAVQTTREPTEAGAAEAVCTVTDNGSGIPDEVRHKIFEPNFSTKTRGTGLGLAITKKSVEDFGGSVRFETTEGVGSAFRVALPAVEG